MQIETAGLIDKLNNSSESLDNMRHPTEYVPNQARQMALGGIKLLTAYKQTGIVDISENLINNCISELDKAVEQANKYYEGKNKNGMDLFQSVITAQHAFQSLLIAIVETSNDVTILANRKH